MYSNNNNNITKDDENFLKEFLKDFYRQIIKIEYYPKFKNIFLTNWTKDYLNHNEKNPEIILKLMENHKESENWFSSLIGFFYEHNNIIIGFDDDDTKFIDKNKNNSLKLYSLSINNKDGTINSMYHLLNIIIAKYLLSFYYYGDIIVSKKVSITNKLENIMSYDHFEYFNGLEINLYKDELSTIEKYFESPDKNFNQNQMGYTKKRELTELNNLGFCFQFGIGKRITKNEKKSFEWN
ncbi:unnamed protein product [Rhizophagus irregularis]|nr:unnamed protein product [Rhizophagus irregularis]